METKEQPIVLVLTREQAQWLIDVTGHAVVGGGRRVDCSDRIYEQLAELGFDCDTVVPDWDGQLIFRRSNDNG